LAGRAESQRREEQLGKGGHWSSSKASNRKGNLPKSRKHRNKLWLNKIRKYLDPQLFQKGGGHCAGPKKKNCLGNQNPHKERAKGLKMLNPQENSPPCNSGGVSCCARGGKSLHQISQKEGTPGGARSLNGGFIQSLTAKPTRKLTDTKRQEEDGTEKNVIDESRDEKRGETS